MRYTLFLCVLWIAFCNVSQGKQDKPKATNTPQYITDSSEYSSLGIDYHDIQSVVAKASHSLLESDFAKSLTSRKLLAIADFSNETSDDVDVEFLSRALAREIAKSKKFTLTNAIAGSGSRAEALLGESFGLINDPNFNQYTTKEKGELLAPDLSLTGRIIERSKIIGENKRVDYQFLLVMTDLTNGKVVWDSEEIISKVIDKDKAQDFAPKEVKKARHIQALERECESGKNESCIMLGDMYYDGEGVEKDHKKAVEYVKKACDGGNAVGCGMLGALYADGDGVAQDYQKASEYLQKACDNVGVAGDIDKWSNICMFYLMATQQAQDSKKPFEYFKKICNSTGTYNKQFQAFSCEIVGEFYLFTDEAVFGSGLVVKQDYEQGFKYFKKSCDMGFTTSCYIVGDLYRKGSGIKQDFKKAFEYYKKACDSGFAESCNNLGVLYVRGEGVAKDSKKALEYYQKACDGRNALGCGNLADLYRIGEGVTKDIQKSIKFYEKACNIGKTQYCVILALLYVNDNDIAQDYKKAFKYFQKACDGSDAQGCYNLGVSYINGQGVRVDRAQAKEYFGKACDLGYQQGCDVYKKLVEAGY